MVKAWRVVLVRPPPGGYLGPNLAASSPGEARIPPLVVAETRDIDEAEQVAARLRATGAIVAVTEGGDAGAWCVDHPLSLAGALCQRCQRPICAECHAAAGQRLCGRCFKISAAKARTTRIRQLFAGFLFVVFLYEVTAWQAAERDALTPPIRVGIFQFAPPGSASHPLIRKLNDAEEGAGRTFGDLAPWYTAQRRRYTGQELPWMNMVIRGPWEREVKPPALPDEADNPLVVAWRAWRYPAWFHGLAREMGSDPDEFGVRVYVMYGAEGADLASHSRGSKQGRVAIVWISLQETNPAYALLTVAHEIGHVLGADDHFDDERFLARFPEGYVDPYADPLYPQRYAELMAVDIPWSRTLEREVRSLQEVQVGHRTAESFGWISPEQAAAYYNPLPASASRPALEAGLQDTVIGAASELGVIAGQGLVGLPEVSGFRLGGEQRILREVVAAAPYAAE